MKSRNKQASLATHNVTPRSKRRRVLVEKAKCAANSPAVRVVLLVVAIVGVVTGVRLVAAKQNFAQVRFVEFSQSDNRASPGVVETAPTSTLFSGEAYNTTARMREAAALGLALSLTAFAEFSEKRAVHSTPEALLGSLIQRRLLPPGIEMENGAVVSPLSRFRLHYQASPLRFEVLSEPVTAQGAALLFRFPLPAGNPGTITYFRTRSERVYQVPNPFSAPEQLVAMGWTIEQWQGELLALDESTIDALREQDQWLRSQK